jgi:hypothetical protein
MRNQLFLGASIVGSRWTPVQTPAMFRELNMMPDLGAALRMRNLRMEQ